MIKQKVDLTFSLPERHIDCQGGIFIHEKLCYRKLCIRELILRKQVPFGLVIDSISSLH